MHPSLQMVYNVIYTSHSFRGDSNDLYELCDDCSYQSMLDFSFKYFTTRQKYKSNLCIVQPSLQMVYNVTNTIHSCRGDNIDLLELDIKRFLITFVSTVRRRT